METDRRLARIEEQVIRLDERQKADREMLIEHDSEVRSMNAALAGMRTDMTAIRLSIDGKVRRAIWGYVIGAAGLIAALAGAATKVLETVGAI